MQKQTANLVENDASRIIAGHTIRERHKQVRWTQQVRAPNEWTTEVCTYSLSLPFFLPTPSPSPLPPLSLSLSLSLSVCISSLHTSETYCATTKHGTTSLIALVHAKPWPRATSYTCLPTTAAITCEDCSGISCLHPTPVTPPHPTPPPTLKAMYELVCQSLVNTSTASTLYTQYGHTFLQAVTLYNCPTST